MKQIAILVRHGESESNIRGLISEDIEGFPLTDNGSATGALIGGEIIGNHSNSSIIQISIAVCLLTVVISFLLSTRFTSQSLH